MYLLDTNVVSALRRADRAPASLLRWAESVDADETYLSVVSVLEIEIGINSRARTDPTQAGILRDWFDRDVLARFEERVLPIDTAIALRCAALHVPDRRPERDALIAATALVHGLTVVTRNISDFIGTGVALIDPWSFESDS